MKFEFDAIKNESNCAKHGIDLSRAEEFDFDTALFMVDDRKDYGEKRYIAYGYIGSRVHAIVFTKRGQTVRVISLRKANEREQEVFNER